MIQLQRTVVPAKDRTRASQFFAEVFGLSVKVGRLAQVRVNETLTLDFVDEADEGSWPRFARPGRGHHFVFQVDDAEFAAILGRVRENGILFGSEPLRANNGRVGAQNGGRRVYLEDPDGHLLAVTTAAETEP
jgi:catechol 2,3-dioxygenase-like lactoylglutathione lyase family enzyme